MQYRKLGRTGWDVSVIGYGAWGIGADWWKGSSDEAAIESLSLALDLGINFIDTAMGYGNGHSERLIGQVLAERPERAYVGTKIRPMNYNFSPKPGDSFAEAFTRDWIVECTEQSLKNLGVETLDLQMLHVWLDEWADREEWQEAVRHLKEKGKIKAFGLSLVFPLEDAHVPQKAIATGLVDVCEVVYNIYQQEAEQMLFPLAEKETVGIVVRCPLDEGALTGKVMPESTFPAEDWRNDYFKGERKQEVYERARALDWLVDCEGNTLSEAALRFSFSHPAVSTSIAGMRRPTHVRSNAEAADRGELAPENRERLREHAWPHNFWA